MKKYPTRKGPFLRQSNLCPGLGEKERELRAVPW